MQLPDRKEIPEHFWNERNAYYAFTSTWFHCGYKKLVDGGYKFTPNKGELIVSLAPWRELLGSMRPDHHYKIAGCAYLLSQIGVMTSYPKGLWIEPPPVISEEERKEKILESITAYAEQETKRQLERAEKIASGEIVLPEKGRPWELWVFDEETSRYKRVKTQRSEHAINFCIANNVKMGQSYKIAFCKGDHEDDRQWKVITERR